MAYTHTPLAPRRDRDNVPSPPFTGFQPLGIPFGQGFVAENAQVDDELDFVLRVPSVLLEVDKGSIHRTQGTGPPRRQHSSEGRSLDVCSNASPTEAGESSFSPRMRRGCWATVSSVLNMSCWASSERKKESLRKPLSSAVSHLRWRETRCGGMSKRAIVFGATHLG